MDRTKAIDVIKQALKTRFPNTDFSSKINEQLEIFRNSEALVYCETCGLIFFSGLSKVVAEERRKIDWKMLAFRHSWDFEDHKVKVSMAYFGLAIFRLNPLLKYFDPLDNTKIDYYRLVADKKQKMVEEGNKRAFFDFDTNWRNSPGSRCYCGVCGSKYPSHKDACYCCRDQKQYLPFSDVDSILD